MIDDEIKKKSRFVIILGGVLLTFCAAAIVLMLAQQRADLMDHAMDDAQRKLVFLSGMVRHTYLEKDYAGAEKMILSQAAMDEHVISLKAVAANGYVLALYEKPVQSTYSMNIQREITDNQNNNILKLVLDYDLSDVDANYMALRDRLVLSVVLFAGLLGLVIWYTLRRLILAPLEHEIEARKWAENSLIRSNDELDQRVNERTQELIESNRGLQSLIREREETVVKMRKLSTAVEQTGDIIIITDSDGITEYVNPAYVKVTGYSFDESVGKTPAIIKSGEHDVEFYEKLWASIRRGEPHVDVFINRCKNGEIYYEQKTITPLKDEQGDITHYLSTGKDITEYKRDQELLEFMASHDELTELPNRALLRDRMHHAILRADRQGNKVVVMFLDLDRFKHINDSLGHPAGDELLRQCSERLKKCVRKGDTIARLGGDEFTIVIEEVDDMENIARLAEKINSVISESFVLDGYEVFSSVSIGITVYPDDAVDIDGLLRNADIAMYRAKEQGSSTYRYYTSDMRGNAIRRLEMQNQLLRALSNNEFELYYQPRIDLASANFCGAEALLRWHSEKYGLVMPAEFIPILEESGLIVDVGNWVLQEACAFNESLRIQGYSDFKIAVNLSARQFKERRTLECLTDLHDGPCSISNCLEVEITESMLMENVEIATHILNKLYSMGINVLVDDFGTGYSSMSYLKRFSICALKIDRSFVLDTPDDKDDVAIVQAIIALGHSLNLKIVAEGVEKKEQFDFLREQGCDDAQGFYISHPLPADDFVQWLLDYKSNGLLEKKVAD